MCSCGSTRKRLWYEVACKQCGHRFAVPSDVRSDEEFCGECGSRRLKRMTKTPIAKCDNCSGQLAEERGQ